MFLSALTRITPHIITTPCTFDPTHNLHFKWESHQPTRSFKVRGALNKILSMEEMPDVLITGSAGNHGQAVALAARKTGTEAWVFVPEKTPNVKVNRMLELGARVEKVPGLYGDAEAKAIATSKKTGFPFISPYNDREVITGAGTIALEWLEQAPTIERVLIPVGGGGLICGVGLAAKEINPEIEIIGVLSESSPYLFHQFYFGHMNDVIEKPTLTDGLAGSVEKGSITIDLLPQACDAIIQVSEEEVARAVAYMYKILGETVEGSGAVGLAAVMSGRIDSSDKVTGALVSGGNIDPEKLQGILLENE